ncbi:hypothetical protein D3C71_1716870 [compost metagenome]
MILLFPVIFIITESESFFLLYTEDACKLEVPSVRLMSCGFAHSNESSALMNKLLHCCYNICIQPPIPTCVGRIAIPYIQNDIDSFKDRGVILNIIKANEFDIKGCTR